MVFVYFGATPDSWAVSNYQYSFAQNLPPAIREVWDRFAGVYDDSSKAGTMISWMSTTPDGSYALMTKGNELLSNRQDLLAAAQPPTSVNHIALSPHGGWLIRFNDETIQVSQNGFPASFATLVGSYLDLSYSGRQQSRIYDVFFGAQGATIVRTDQSLLFDGVPQELQNSLQAFTHGDLRLPEFILGLHTVLCPWDSRYYFLEAQAQSGPPRYIYQLPTQQVPNEMISSIISGQIPPPHTIPQSNHQAPSSTSMPPPRQPPSSQQPGMFPGEPQPDMPPAIRARYEYQFQVESKGKPYLTGIEAAMMFQESGLPREELGRIWEQTDKDKNGQFDKEEFIHAMWLIELHTGRVERPGSGGHSASNSQSHFQGYPNASPAPPNGNGHAYQQQPPYQQQQPPYPQQQQQQPPYQQQQPYLQQGPPYQQPLPQQPPYQQQPPYGAPQQQIQPPNTTPPGEISKATLCKSCGNGLAPDDIAYFCPVCGVDQGFHCQNCPQTKQCPHNLQQVTLTLGKDTKAHPHGTLACNGCGQTIKKGSVAWHCQKCWERDLDAKCWRKKKRHCKHAKLDKVDMVKTESMGSKEKSEMFSAIGEVAGALLGAG